MYQETELDFSKAYTFLSAFFLKKEKKKGRFIYSLIFSERVVFFNNHQCLYLVIMHKWFNQISNIVQIYREDILQYHIT